MASGVLYGSESDMLSDKDIKICLKEMFNRVGVEYSIDYCSKKGWCEKNTWTIDQEECFRKWLTDFIKKKTNYTKEYCREQASWFLLHNGWKTK